MIRMIRNKTRRELYEMRNNCELIKMRVTSESNENYSNVMKKLQSIHSYAGASYIRL
jgi:hypothetical protein